MGKASKKAGILQSGWRSDLHLRAQHWKLWDWDLFLTAHNFANRLHFVTFTQLRATKTGSNICCTNLSYTFYESWVRKDSVGTCPKKVSQWKFMGTEQFTKKFRFSVSACKQSIGLVKYSFFLWRLPLRKGGATKSHFLENLQTVVNPPSFAEDYVANFLW